MGDCATRCEPPARTSHWHYEHVSVRAPRTTDRFEMPLTATSHTTNQELTHEDVGMMREIEVKK